MTRAILIAALAVVIGACTIVKINKDDTTTIEHKAGAGVGQDLAAQACRRAGRQTAEIVSTHNKDAQLPPGAGTQVTTFKCSGAS